MGFNCLKARATSRRQFTFYHSDPVNAKSSTFTNLDSVNAKSSTFRWCFKFFEVCKRDFEYFFQQHLVLNPSHRITAEEAMQHVYFADLSPTVKNM